MIFISFIPTIKQKLLTLIILCIFSTTVYPQNEPFLTQETLIGGSDYARIHAVSISDFDKDGDQDILVLDYQTKTVNALLNDGNGEYNSSEILASVPDISFRANNINIGDFNSDGNPDILVGNYILTQDENRVFNSSLVDQSLKTEDISHALVGDIDKDGHTDIVLMEASTVFSTDTRSKLKYYKNDGTGNFEFVSEGIGNTQKDPLLADIDQNGFLDLLTGSNRYHINTNGDLFSVEAFSSKLEYDTGTIADIDSDGDIDIISSFAGIQIFYNDGTGDGDVEQVDEAFPPSSIRDIEIVDIDGDSNPDILVTSSILDRAIVYLNDGTGGFTDYDVLQSSNGSISTKDQFDRQTNIIKASDIDNDENLEIIHVRFDADHINVIDSITSQTTVKTVNKTPHYSPINRVKTFDVDQDGKVEVIPIGSSGASIFQTINDGQIANEPLFRIQEKGISEITFSDFDGDNDIDLILNVDSLDTQGRIFSFSVIMFENDGAENFSKTTLLDWDEDQSDLIDITVPKFRDVADFDGDGDQDLIFDFSGSTIIYSQDENGFSVARDFEISNLIYSLNSDEDKDGIAELYGRNSGNSQNNLVYFEFNDEIETGIAINIYSDEVSFSFKKAELNGDGIIDFIVPNDDAIAVILSDGNAFDYNSTPILVGSEKLERTFGFYGFRLGDIDNDSDSDIIVEYLDPNDRDKYLLTTYQNNGDFDSGNSFAEIGEIELKVDRFETEFSVSDINSDGKVDVLLAKQGTNDIDVIYNTYGSTVSNEDVINDRPDEYFLSQNYPNPFNPTTQISFNLPEASNVKLQVFNTLGQSVLELTNERRNAGFHTITFDASDLSSGLYMYRITARSFTETKKMLLIK